MKQALLLLLVFTALCSRAQPGDEQKIRDLLHRQTEAWNRGDLNDFMQTYWQSDSLMFIGKTGVVWGWQKTLDNYKRSYPSKEAMGTLSFDIIQIKKLSPEYYSVVGKWMLQRINDTLSGHYTLLLKKIKGEWKIISDHSS
ncbi:MAG: nuclear transport factor 2 family protein [Flavisolibacter sp.]|nr:nuclear transport factor 2 family protein [Flavisolibacter sp.]MBD0298290.1 nuclear transport factor 2 family protein [Flavisolibacter sp.]MBD0352520.1 nuclear transport factor 2 family protein [Flavisolibacter sp.]MBD0377172.1 nuclear transport factor 2 family protein [Flavisolibacter sp.]